MKMSEKVKIPDLYLYQNLHQKSMRSFPSTKFCRNQFSHYILCDPADKPTPTYHLTFRRQIKGLIWVNKKKPSDITAVKT